MDTIELLLKRRSVVAANITEPGPDAAALDTILRAATRVPDHGKLAPWRIQVLHKEGQRRLGDVLADLFAGEIPDANDKQVEFERQRPQRAPLLLVVTAKIRKHHKIPEMEQMLSGGAVCTNILIAANALGFCAQWLTEWPAYRPEVARALGHDPESDQIVGLVYIGTPVEAPAERPRPALGDVVSEWTGETVAAE
jgi:nitroreductase